MIKTCHRHRSVARLGALVFAGAVAVGACGSSTAAAPGTTGSTVVAATSSTTVDPVPVGTSVPAVGASELRVVTTPYGAAIGTNDGLVVYAWDKEADGTLACADAACLEKWPPLLATSVPTATGVAATLTLVDRPDGTKQVALDGKRLYHMAIDRPGEANCQGAEGWWILHPDGSKNTSRTPVS